MHIIVGDSFQEVYLKSIQEILDLGDEVAPRGSKTFELAPATLVINDARKFLAIPGMRKGNYTFQLAEALWMIRGSNDLEEIAHYNSVWRYFEDEDEPGILNGAYGERLRNWGQDGVDQFVEVYQKLKKDPYSRQAVMIIFDPERDNAVHENGNYSKDIPCTNYFNFQIRDGKLNMWTVMRSNDLHKGTLYDIPNFIIFQHILAGWLEVEVGKYTHSTASFHIYESDVENFKEIQASKNKLVYIDGQDYGDPKIPLLDFNKTLSTVMAIEYTTRTLTKDGFDDLIVTVLRAVNTIENTWWRSVAAQIAAYNYRKLGASEDEFKKFLPLITNEYRTHVEGWKAIKK